jgi:hypothetical protein
MKFLYPILRQGGQRNVIFSSAPARARVVGGRGKSGEIKPEELKELVSAFWSGFTGEDYDQVPQKYLYCRSCSVRSAFSLTKPYPVLKICINFLVL